LRLTDAERKSPPCALLLMVSEQAEMQRQAKLATGHRGPRLPQTPVVAGGLNLAHHVSGECAV
jgi:hypothetical protein